MRLACLASHVPAARIGAEEIIRAAGGSPAEARVFERMFGLEQVAAVPQGQTLAQQFDHVLRALTAQYRGALPDVLIYVHGQPFQYAAGQSPVEALCANQPLLSGITRRYEVDQYNCGGLFWALDLARTLLRTGLARAVLVLGGDSHIGLPLGDRYVPGCTLMGDAFCGLILDQAPGGLRVGDVALCTHPRFARGRAGTSAEMGDFFAAHGGIVCQALSRIGFDWDSACALLPHNVNRLAWQMFSRETGLAPERLRLSLLPEIGHCYTSDPFLLLEREQPSLGDGQACAILSIGMGGYAGAALITRSPPADKTVPRSSSPAPSKKEHPTCLPLILS
ncbi:hypothetical protein [Phaeobacter sp.]|uniref:hypothetical protein n=1 Tax=Phaeobacter sp. TaxID=1902409 RepID=UPI0025E78315|nr:hypothetical protein [Phaeobacter sp.]